MVASTKFRCIKVIFTIFRVDVDFFPHFHWLSPNGCVPVEAGRGWRPAERLRDERRADQPRPRARRPPGPRHPRHPRPPRILGPRQGPEISRWALVNEHDNNVFRYIISALSFYSQLYIVTNGRVKWAVGRVLTRVDVMIVSCVQVRGQTGRWASSTPSPRCRSSCRTRWTRRTTRPRPQVTRAHTWHVTRDTRHCCRVRRSRAHGQHGDGHVPAGHDVDARAVPLDEGEEVLTETNAR